MLKAEYIGESPSIDIDRTNYSVGNYVTITISEFEISLDEADATELLDGLEETLIPFDETRSGLEAKIEKLEDELQGKESEIDRLKEEIESLEKRLGDM